MIIEEVEEAVVVDTTMNLSTGQVEEDTQVIHTIEVGKNRMTIVSRVVVEATMIIPKVVILIEDMEDIPMEQEDMIATAMETRVRILCNMFASVTLSRINLTICFCS